MPAYGYDDAGTQCNVRAVELSWRRRSILQLPDTSSSVMSVTMARCVRLAASMGARTCQLTSAPLSSGVLQSFLFSEADVPSKRSCQ